MTGIFNMSLEQTNQAVLLPHEWRQDVGKLKYTGVWQCDWEMVYANRVRAATSI